MHYPEDDVCLSKDDSNSTSLDKVAFSKFFQDMINLVTGYFPNAKPSLPVHSNSRQHSQRVFLNCFDKLLAISKEVDEKFWLAAEDNEKASFCLPH